MSSQAARVPALRSDAVWLLLPCGLVLALLVGLVKSGVLAGGIAPDSAGYLAAAASATPWGEPRHPLYGYFAGLFGASASGIGYVALVQAILHALASLALFAG